MVVRGLGINGRVFSRKLHAIRLVNGSRVDGKGRHSNPDSTRLARQLQTLSKSLTHEIHHALRMRSVGYGRTLGEALVSEGLAQCFELETGHGESRYSKNLTKSEVLEISERARAFILSGQKSYNHSHWFHGTEKDQDAKEYFKHWSGCSLGFALVSSWLGNEKVNGGYETAGKAVHLSADAILKPWLEKGNEVLIAWLETTSGFPAECPACSLKNQNAYIPR